jgi:uncharacterized lipoprotein
MRRTRFLLLGSVAALALALAGCSGGSSDKQVTKAQYEQKLEAIGHDLYKAANELGADTNTSIFNENLDALEKVLDDSADELDDVKPPLDARPANDRLVDAYRTLADDLEKVKDARRESYPRAIAALKAVQHSAAARATRRAVQELRRLKYKVQVFVTL